MNQYLWIALGSGLGGAVRFAISNATKDQLGEGFPWGTFFINVLGSFLIGLVAMLTQGEGRFPLSESGRQFLMIGVLGGFTTYSAFSLQTLALAMRGEWMRAGTYAVGTFALCFLAVWAGWQCAVLVSAGKPGA